MDNREFNEVWNKPVIKVGMITLLLGAVTSFLPCFYLYFAHGVIPNISTILKSWGMIASLFGAFYIVEPISYYSIFGLAGTYLSFLSGNMSNVRIPCAAMALEATETKPATKEAEIVSTLGITGSIITNLIGVTLAAFVGAALIKVLPPTIADAFKNYTVPAIFGAVFGQFSLKYPKLGVVGIGIPAVLRLTTKLPSWVLIIASVFGTIVVAKIMYNKENLNKDKEVTA
ncbi:hypothetical protein CLOACE_10480 [Clostridium acetireducens DSM 10703]|jgi:hypothetical protein|uniref:Uncharacterized protein n=1 Tax=Clostridium acetireducens DSM 10703 TaxID=1121290 RepID=A0A1E8EZG4_9CLOT|nr:hypothetical protein [Clostridium acetireducens]OFI06275.1 hypothetical protein CLOACE_10480 [Clostridium acetireducens DSM 10703]